MQRRCTSDRRHLQEVRVWRKVSDAAQLWSGHRILFLDQMRQILGDELDNSEYQGKPRGCRQNEVLDQEAHRHRVTELGSSYTTMKDHHGMDSGCFALIGSNNR